MTHWISPGRWLSSQSRCLSVCLHHCFAFAGPPSVHSLFSLPSWFRVANGRPGPSSPLFLYKGVSVVGNQLLCSCNCLLLHDVIETLPASTELYSFGVMDIVPVKTLLNCSFNELFLTNDFLEQRVSIGRFSWGTSLGCPHSCFSVSTANLCISSSNSFLSSSTPEYINKWVNTLPSMAIPNWSFTLRFIHSGIISPNARDALYRLVTRALPDNRCPLCQSADLEDEIHCFVSCQYHDMFLTAFRRYLQLFCHFSPSTDLFFFFLVSFSQTFPYLLG